MDSNRNNSLTKIMTYILLLAGTVIVLLPFWYMLITSLKPQAFIFELPPRLWPSEISLINYQKALQTDQFGLYFMNSLFVAVVTTASTLLVSSLMAYAFARLKFRGKEFLFYFLLSGMMVPPVMLIIPQFIVARFLNLPDKFLGLILVYITMNLSMQTFLLRGYFEGLPSEIEDAALVDGASRWKIFWKIVLPLSRPGLAVVTIFTFLFAWEEFPWANVAIKEATKRTLPIAIALFQSQHLTEWGQVFAASIMGIIPVVIVFAVFQKHFIRGISSSGIKG